MPPAGRLKDAMPKWGGRLVGVAVYALATTLRPRFLFFDRVPDRETPSSPAPPGTPGLIVSLWHGRMLYPAYVGRKLKPTVLVSMSRDGELLAGVLRTLGYQTVRGSSSRGGASALRKLLRTLKAGYDVCIASDGPRGPAFRVQAGIIHLASRSGVPIVPAVFGAAHAKIFGSWDRFCLPYPFTPVTLVFGRPVTVPRGADEALLEAKRLELEMEMNWAMSAADAAARKESLPPEPDILPESQQTEAGQVT
jgi:lysophospholipid acyltransferase (LPLAT)-like uncharacterized protein